MHQNDVPVVKAIQIANHTEFPLKQLRIRIDSEPAFAEPWEALIDGVTEGGEYRLEAVDLNLVPGYLYGLTERVKGRLRFELFSDGSTLADEKQIVELLARDEWGGLSSLPEILAAFVTPNDKAVEQILRQASSLLADWTDDSSISGYQTRDKARVWMIASAIYGTLQSLNITYLNPPASFETEGQRIRLPQRIMENRLAACLDLATLTAACLEQAGLNPLVILVTGHAFVGVWLVDECFGEPAMDDVLRLRKRVDLKEIGVFDPTCITAAGGRDMDRASKEARRQLDDPDRFCCAVDVKRARRGQIRPLPDSMTSPQEELKDTSQKLEVQHPLPPDISAFQELLPRQEEARTEEQETPSSRIQHWRRRLLDLTLRNRLLNFKSTKKTIPLIVSDVNVVEDKLAAGTVFKISPRPTEMAAGDPRDPDSFRRRTGNDAVGQLLSESLESKKLHADLPPQELDRRLLEVFRAARLGVEEGGASALFLGMGFLLWYESPTSQIARKAPILLLPVVLQRKSSLEGFRLSLSGDEARVNVTLLELLKKDHGIVITELDPLPEDDSGLDVYRILHTFREKIRDIDRWDILEECHLGIFSFAKFLMWRDLTERTDDLLENPLVDHLVNRPGQPFDADGAFPNPDRLDSDKSPLETFCPLPADASQLAAIYAAEAGRSYVLEGPPGTGKSQTIGNLIAHCLANGKSVLFVSEKMAALSVVQNRLRQVGLGRYCLELHSQKANKSEVFAQIQEALSDKDAFSVEEWEREAKRLESLRVELNSYVQSLHARRSTGETVFHAISKLIGLRHQPLVQLNWPSPDYFDADGLSDLRDLVKRLAVVGAAAGEVHGHPWAASAREDWNPSWQNQVSKAMQIGFRKIKELQKAAEVISKRLSLGESGWNYNTLKLINNLAKILLESPGPPDSLLMRPDWDDVQARLDHWIQHGRQRDALRTLVYEDFTERIIQLDLEQLLSQHQHASASRWLLGWWRMLPVKKALKSVSRNGRAPDAESLAAIIENARQLKAEETALSMASDEARDLLGRFWNEGEARWDEIIKLRKWSTQFRALAAEAAGDDFEKATRLRNCWARIVTEGREMLSPEAVIGRELTAYREAYQGAIEALNKLSKLMKLNQTAAWGAANKAGFLEKVKKTIVIWSKNLPGLSGWCAWRRVRRQAISSGLQTLVSEYETGRIHSSNLYKVFEHSYYLWWYTELVSREKILSHFFSPEHEKKIQMFRDTDDQYMALTKSLVAARLAEKVPNSSAVNMQNSEMGILRREMSKKRRQMPVRKLLQAVPNLISRLKPCLLMSPISVAQYLDAKYPPFDLVVFDEASQIPVWDAIGVIARGKSSIIVGDPKQLPPTSFFQRLDDADEDAVDDGLVEDLESILEECLGAGVPQLSLQWHYRSRHESLIAFSNYHYYDNNLLTFPSPFREGMGVQWQYVANGTYDRGKSATNREEANAVVKEIVRRLKDNKLKEHSIGVVTFSMAQQTLIEDILEQVRRNNVDIDHFFSDEIAEPVFIKNLENVQGDERDVILFSICYGPDMQGKVTMNFGPMNREGGERRLNVAITRSRREVIVFSSLRADQIDLSRTRARGVRDLKNFLDYAERGPSAIPEAASYNPNADFDSPFEKVVHDALVVKGWIVHLQVGCARYRIDLAVVDPESPGRYLLGIECDGANYHRAKTARDRDKLRESVLHNLGWRLHRIWSTDWWKDPSQELTKVLAAIKKAKAEKSRLQQGSKPDAGLANQMHGIFARSLSQEQASSGNKDDPDERKSPQDTPATDNVYQVSKIPAMIGPAELFYEPQTTKKISELSAIIVRQEGPISLRLLTSRLIQCWEMNRVTQKAQNRVLKALPKSQVQVTHEKTRIFLWSADKDPEKYRQFRVPGPNEDSIRDADDLPIVEVANAIYHTLRPHISAPEEELIRETSRVFGFGRAGRKVKQRIVRGIEYLLKYSMVERNGDNIILCDKRE